MLSKPVLKKLLTHNADPMFSSNNLKGFPIFLIASSFLAGRKVPPIDDNIGHVLFDFLDFHARKCDHASVVIAPAGGSVRVGFDGIEDCTEDDLIVVNPCPRTTEGINATKGCVGKHVCSSKQLAMLTIFVLYLISGSPDSRLSSASCLRRSKFLP